MSASERAISNLDIFLPSLYLSETYRLLTRSNGVDQRNRVALHRRVVKSTVERMVVWWDGDTLPEAGKAESSRGIQWSTPSNDYEIGVATGNGEISPHNDQVQTSGLGEHEVEIITEITFREAFGLPRRPRY